MYRARFSALAHRAQCPLQVAEVHQQPNLVQPRPFHRHLHAVIVAVRIGALAGVAAQGVAGRKTVLHS
jgi:hypothetical protein